MERRTRPQWPQHSRDISGIVAEVLEESFAEERRQSSRKCRLKPGQVTRETTRGYAFEIKFPVPGSAEKSHPERVLSVIDHTLGVVKPPRDPCEREPLEIPSVPIFICPFVYPGRVWTNKIREYKPR